MNGNKNNTGIGFWGLLTIVFIVLKLTKVINWLWLWVLAPTWIPVSIIIIIGIILWIINKKSELF